MAWKARADEALLHKRLARGGDGQFVQLGSQAGAISVGLCCSESLAQLGDFLFAGSASANFRSTAGCGHDFVPLFFSLNQQYSIAR